MDEVWAQKAKELSEKLKKSMDRDAMQDIMKEAKGFVSAGDYEGMQRYFNEVYESVYHDMIFHKMAVNNATRALLETLSLPVRSESEKKNIIRTVKLI